MRHVTQDVFTQGNVVSGQELRKLMACDFVSRYCEVVAQYALVAMFVRMAFSFRSGRAEDTRRSRDDGHCVTFACHKPGVF